MQKKIIALAVAAAFSAPAFADTTVYGIVDAAITSTSKTGMKSQMNVASGGLSTSRFGVKATEGLDNGMTAVAVLEYALYVNDNTTVGVSGAGALKARQQMVALAGDFGTVAAGYLQTAGYDFSGKYNPFAGSAVDPYSSANPTSFITTGSRASRAAAYISPDFNGVTFAYNHSFDAGQTGMVASGATTGNVTTANLISVNFAQGPLSVGGVYAGTANDNTGYAAVTEFGLGASYDLGAAKLLGTYLNTKASGGNADKMVNFSAVIPAGPGTVVLGFAKNTKDSTAAADDTTAFTAAFLKGMSKTVTAYGALEQVKLDGATTTTTTVLAVGLRKKF